MVASLFLFHLEATYQTGVTDPVTNPKKIHVYRFFLFPAFALFKLSILHLAAI
jgi:hypothetical protein